MGVGIHLAQAGGILLFSTLPSLAGLCVLTQLLSGVGWRAVTHSLPPVSKEFIQGNNPTGTHQLIKLNQ